MVLLSSRATAQDRNDSTTVHKFLISYPVNETVLYEYYQDNARNLRIIREHFKRSPRIDSIVIYSYASPEGPYDLNVRLAKERGERARKYLLENISPEIDFPDSLIIVNHTPENWQGLYEMVTDTYPYHDKQDVLDLLEREDVSSDYRKVLLKKLNGGRPWEFIRTNILPKLRYASWVADWVYVPDVAPLTRPDFLQQGLAPLDTTLKSRSFPVERRKTLLALKTNLLYDAVTWLNFSIEVPVYRDRFSLLYNHQFPWWTLGQADNEYCNRFLSIGAEARWWFKPNDILKGHFLGVYAESGKYDFEYQRSICYQGEFSSAGLTYGYSMSVARSLNLEFSVSVGYVSIAYRGYTPSEDYELLFRDRSKVGRLHYLGPSKAQISLVIPIEVAERKGGGR